jgi:hypothetical protein
LGLLADSEFRFHVRQIGQRVNERYELGTPVTTSYCGIPLLRVRLVFPPEFDEIVLPIKKDPEPDPVKVKKEPLYLVEDSYPLAGVWAFQRGDKTLGALVIMSLGDEKMCGDFLQHPSQLNEIGAEVGGFTGFDRV